MPLKGGCFVDQKKIGNLLKALRKEKGMTQEQLAEQLRVSNRTVSRWETGSNMPDLDLLIEIADYYDVDIRDLLDGERKCEKMNNELQETVLKVAEYSNEEERMRMKKLHWFSWIGVIAFVIYLTLDVMGYTTQGVTAAVADFSCGLSFGMLIIGVIYTSRHINRMEACKARLRDRQ